MIIDIYDPSSDPSMIRGFTIVVDVFRAFSVSYYIAQNDPCRYIVVDDIDEAFSIKRSIPGSVLIGERNGIKIPGFDYGNSPTEIFGQDFKGKTIIHTTSAGTKGLVAQPRFNDVVVGSFVNAEAIVKYIERSNIDRVNIYCTAEKGSVIGEEDFMFAESLSNRLNGIKNDYKKINERLRAGSGKGFSDTGFAPHSDFTYCMDLDRFDFVLRRVAASDNECGMELERIT